MSSKVECRIARNVVAIFLLLSASIAVGWAEARDLIEITAPHFTMVSVLSESDTRDLVEQMRTFEGIVTSFTTVDDVRPQAPLRIYLVSSYDWDKYFTPNKFTAGYMSPSTFSFVGVMDGQNWLSASRLLFHEYVHFVMRNADSNAYPQWFDEGLAETLATARISKSKVRVGEPPTERLKSLEEFQGARWIPLQQVLTAMPKVSNENDKLGPEMLGFYVESWALVHYLIFDQPGGNKALGQYLRLTKEGMPVDEAFPKAFGMSVAQMEEVLKRYVSPRPYKVLDADRSKLPQPPQATYGVRQLTTLDSQIALGQLMMRVAINREKVPAYFDVILKAHPKNALALAGKANALALIQQFAKADDAIKEALDLEPTNPEVLIEAGDIESLRRAAVENSESAVSERQELRRKNFDYYDRAMVTPYSGLEDLEVVVRYADLALEFHENLDRPMMQMERMRKTYPTEPFAAATHARMLMTLNRSAEARAAWVIAARYGRDALRDVAIRAITSIDSQGH
jgi:tetratricopeptide (TPR) repeat protein